MKTLEVRLPSADRWTKILTDIALCAKTGHDWAGDFARGGNVVDLRPGTVIASCNDVGSRRAPEDKVVVSMLMPTGKWAEVAQARGKEWAIEMREEVRPLLDLEPEERMRKFITECLAKRNTALGNQNARLAKAQEILAALPALMEAGGPINLPKAKKNEDEPIRLTMGDTAETVRPQVEARIAELREVIAATEESARNNTELLALLTPAPEAAPVVEANPLAEFSDEQIIAEMSRRGLTL